MPWYLGGAGRLGGFGVILWARRESRRSGDPEAERLDTPAGDVGNDVNGADKCESSRGRVCAFSRRGDGQDAEVTEDTDGYRSEGRAF